MSWTARFGQSCSIAEDTYKVLVHSIRVDSINLKRVCDVAKLHEENQALHNGLKITRVSWLNRGHAPGNTHASLIVGVATKEMANGIIQSGLVGNFALHLAEYYSPESRLTQCFKYQAYGHVAPVCRKVEACGYCTGKHHMVESITYRSVPNKRSSNALTVERDTQPGITKPVSVEQPRSKACKPDARRRPALRNDHVRPSASKKSAARLWLSQRNGSSRRLQLTGNEPDQAGFRQSRLLTLHPNGRCRSKTSSNPRLERLAAHHNVQDQIPT